MLSWTDFDVKSVHENVFRGFRGHFLWKIAQSIRVEKKVGATPPAVAARSTRTTMES